MKDINVIVICSTIIVVNFFIYMIFRHKRGGRIEFDMKTGKLLLKTLNEDNKDKDEPNEADIKDKKMDEFVNTSYNQTQKEILSELTAFDRKESEELVSKLQKAWMEQNWEEYDRIMIENGINSNISVKAKAYENTKTYKTTKNKK